uniref:Ferritin n=1 Tax=Sinocyclocheilus grahami TaxID=75366 RepID=A0A672QPI3_SINGR
IKLQFIIKYFTCALVCQPTHQNKTEQSDVQYNSIRSDFRSVFQAKIFEQRDVALPRVSAYFHQESVKELERAEAMLQYLSQRGGKYCNKNIQRPCTEEVCAVLPALEMMLNQWKEEMSVMLELNQLAHEYGDPHTASVIKSQFIQPLVPKVKLIGDLLTSALRVGCTGDSTGGFGEYLIDRLQETA